MAQLPGDARVNQYTATSGQTTFTYDFQIYDDDEIMVQQNGTVLTLTTHYTVTDAGEEAGGTIILVTGATEDDIITLTGNTMVETDTTFTDGGEFAASAINGEYTKLDNLVSELVTESSKYLQFLAYDASFDTKITTATANRCIVVNSDGDGLEMSTYDPDEAQSDASDYADAASDSADAASASEEAAALSETAASGYADDASGYADAASASADSAAASAAAIAPAAFGSDLIPDANNTRDLGSNTKKWAEVRCMDAYVGDDLSVTDDASIGGDLTLTGGLTLNTNKFTVAAATGNTVVAGTLSVGGSSVVANKSASYTYTVAQGTHGGSYGTGFAWTIRPINTEEDNSIGATLATNRITLPAGTYHVVAAGPVYNLGAARFRIYDYTNTTSLIVGGQHDSAARQMCQVSGTFTLAAEAAIEIDMQASSTQANDGMGQAVNNASWGTETYLSVSIAQLA